MLSAAALRLSATSSARALAYPTLALRKPTTSVSAIRTYASQSDPSHPRGTADTSTAHPTVPHAPPKPTPFFAWKNIGLEVTPLMAFIATIAVVATGALVRNLLTDPDIHSRHGVEVDDKLKKVLETPGDSKTGQEEKKQSK